MLSRFTKFLTVIAFGILILPAISFGQIIDESFALKSELGVETIPNYPRPNEMVSINLTLYTGDLNSANITWYKDGKTVLSGKGETKYSFKTGSVGQQVRIEVAIRLLNGIYFSKSFTLNPADVDLIWEAYSYVPPFYKGKALHPKQGLLKIVAMPEFVKDGVRISPQNLVYKWLNGINVYQNQSGYGKNTVIVSGSMLGQEENIEVLVTDPVSNLTAQGFLTITTTNPEIVFYENNPYYGHIFDSAITSTFDLKSEEVQILAAPYYFTNENYGLLKYKWQLNDQDVPNLVDSRTAVFKKPETGTGQSTISLQVENTNRILQQADSSLIMNFENK
jgi:hypothetical protein